MKKNMKKLTTHITKHTEGKPVAQGDMILMPVDSLPTGATEVKPGPDGKFIVAHSETGHHHVASGADVKYFTKGTDGMIAYIMHTKPVKLEHLRSFDTHEPFSLRGNGKSKSVWEIRRQREHTPQGMRRVED